MPETRAQQKLLRRLSRIGRRGNSRIGRRLHYESLEERKLLAVDATLSLGVPVITGLVARFEVSLDFQATEGERLSYFSLDVEPSSPSLVGAGQDYSAFSFDKSSPLLDNWRQIGFFDDPGFESSVEFDDALVGSLAAGNYGLGTLSVDFGAAGLTTDDAFTVAINGTGTVIGVDDPGQGFGFRDVDFNPASRLVGAVRAHGPETVLEGSPYTLTIQASRNLGGTLLINWGDSETLSIPVADLPAGGELTHLFADGAESPSIQVEIELSAGDRQPVGTVNVTVVNVAPTITVTGGASVDEGSPFSMVLGAVVDPGADTVAQYVVDWGDGQRETVDAADLPANRELTHVYADGPLAATISVNLVDEDGEHPSAGTLQVNVLDVAPTVTASGPAETTEGSAYTLTIGQSIDPGADTIHEFVIDWGDGTEQTVAAADLPANRRVEHVFGDGTGARTISIDAIDEDGRHPSIATLAIDVLSRIPDVVLGGSDSANVGVPYVVSVDGLTGPGSERVHRLVIDWGDESQTEIDVDDLPANRQLTHTYVIGPGGVTIRLRLLDAQGVVLGEVTRQIELLAGGGTIVDRFDNSAEVPGETLSTEDVSVVGEFTNPAGAPLPTAVIDWGDGSDPGTVEVVPAPGGGRILESHEYSDGGVYIIRLSLTGPNGTVTRETRAYVTGIRRERGIIQIVGSDENDIVTVTPQGTSQIFVSITTPPTGNIRRTFDLADVSGIDVYVGAGNDRIMVSERLEIPTYLDGGDDDDHVQGGDGPNFIIGGTGNDTLLGGGKRDILVGGGRSNLVLAYDGDDVLMGGDWANPIEHRPEIFSVWDSDIPLEERQALIASLIEIAEDTTSDELFGGDGENLYYASLADLIQDHADIQYSIQATIELGWAVEHEEWEGIFTVIVTEQQTLPEDESTTATIAGADEGSEHSNDANATQTESLSATEGESLPRPNPLDVNGDGFVTPIDVVVVINALNSGNRMSVPSSSSLDADVNGWVTPADALVIINFLNAQSATAIELSNQADLATSASLVLGGEQSSGAPTDELRSQPKIESANSTLSEKPAGGVELTEEEFLKTLVDFADQAVSECLLDEIAADLACENRD